MVKLCREATLTQHPKFRSAVLTMACRSGLTLIPPRKASRRSRQCSRRPAEGGAKSGGAISTTSEFNSTSRPGTKMVGDFFSSLDILLVKLVWQTHRHTRAIKIMIVECVHTPKTIWPPPITAFVLSRSGGQRPSPSGLLQDRRDRDR